MRSGSKLRSHQRQPRLPEGLRIYAIGDVHGRADLLGQLFGLIDADLARRPAERILHVMLGDYVDRGPASRAVIDAILARADRRELVALKGNHDALLLQALDEPTSIGDWLLMHGVETLGFLWPDLSQRRGRQAERSQPRFRDGLAPQPP